MPPTVQQVLSNQRDKLAGAEVPASAGKLQLVLEQAINQALVNSFRLIMLIAIGLAVASAGTAARMIKDSEA